VNRRDLLLGGAMLMAAGAGQALTPRRRLVLLPDGQRLEDIVPAAFGGWATVPSDNFVLPRSEGSLADRLYNQTLTRLYVGEDRLPVMLVIAYGAVQNDQLQLHRPEVCYKAIGFDILGSRVQRLGLAALYGPGAELPLRELEAVSPTRAEAISYWTRIGDDLPTDGSSQRLVKLRQQMAGYLADGVLVRLSTAAPASDAVFAELSGFARAMLGAMKADDRDVLLGRTLSRTVDSALNATFNRGAA
jgi:EpsI family protein